MCVGGYSAPWVSPLVLASGPSDASPQGYFYTLKNTITSFLFNLQKQFEKSREVTLDILQGKPP
jgi:hypothetical protein